MADERTRLDKLMAMAVQNESPAEAKVAQDKLATMGMWPPPPPPPTAHAATPFPQPDGTGSYTWSYNSMFGGQVMHVWGDGTWVAVEVVLSPFGEGTNDG